jgi:hypothetical protein
VDVMRAIELAAAVDALVREDFAGRVLPFDAAPAVRYADLIEIASRGRSSEGFGTFFR